jgi:signal transduction histidine kinase
LKIAQLDAGKVVLRFSPINLRQFLNNLLEEYADVIAPKNQTIELAIDKTAPELFLIDEENFRMALSNLIDNASKYSYEGGNILVTARGSADSVSVSVKDSGIGIDPADQKHLFEKFSRINNEFSGSVGGSGLGLYWVKRVIEMHHGNIKVDAKKRKGSTFTIALPREVAHA